VRVNVAWFFRAHDNLTAFDVSARARFRAAHSRALVVPQTEDLQILRQQATALHGKRLHSKR
jgi:hypothetical protein